MRFIRSFFLFIISVVIVSPVQAQSLQISVTNQTNDHGPTVFQLGDQSVLLRENVVKYLGSDRQFSGFLSYGISPDITTLGMLQRSFENSPALVLDQRADTLAAYSPSGMEASDPSLAIYPFSNGQSIIRQNIGRFAFYNALGKRQAIYSSVTGSEGGESISKLASDLAGQTVVLYNPKIVLNGGEGSRAHITQSNGNLMTFFSSSDRLIESLKVTANGQFIGLLTVKEGTNRALLVYDRFGNQLSSMQFEDAIQDFTLSESAQTLLVYSEQRALAYDLISGEKLGSTSFRSNVVHADYFSSDHLIIALTGRPNPSGKRLNNVQVHAIHLEKREITSKEWSGTLGLHPKLTPGFTRKTPNTYLLKGTSKQLNIKANF